MRIIIGLGNPGEKYKNTRHNVGFLVLDELRKQILNSKQQILNKSQLPNFKFQKKFNAEILKLTANRYQLGADLLLVKPQNFMNQSGVCVKKIIDYYKNSHNPLPITHYLHVVHDDLDIKLGEYKIQFGKGPKVHNGVRSVEKYLRTKDFWRARIGIAGEHYQEIKADKNKNIADDYVLKPFSRKERKILDKVLEKIIIQLLASSS